VPSVIIESPRPPHPPFGHPLPPPGRGLG
jgi:hypothetical protein